MFPSDRYAVMGVARAHGLDPDDAVVILAPRPGERHLRTEDVTGFLDREGASVAVVVLSAIDFRTGALLDMPAITAAAHRAGARIGWDLAHAAGNIPLRLHDWDVDFAVWCHYKYVNAGPGAVGGCFVHERHGTDPDAGAAGRLVGARPGLAVRHAVRLRPGRGCRGLAGLQPAHPGDGAGAACRWRCSPRSGWTRLRAAQRAPHRIPRATARRRRRPTAVEVITPRQPDRRGAQLSVMVDDAAALTEGLFVRHRVRADDRPPNIIRLAPAPLYNTYDDCWRAAVALDDVLA